MSPNYAETVLLKLSVKKARVPVGFSNKAITGDLC